MALNQGPLQLSDNPIDAFKVWFEEAKRTDLKEPTAMTLATASAGGRPSARIVLLKGVDENGFSFFTNYQSKKSHDLEQNPWASLVFHWQPLCRQVRIEGRVERVSKAESDEYFHSRPRGSQIGAWSSPQSQVIPDRETLVRLVTESEKRFEGHEVERPMFWGGYRVIPNRIEFWEEREFRLHERCVFELIDGQWVKSRLAP